MVISDESISSLIVSLIRTREDAQSFNFVLDNLNLKITSQLLDGLNYVQWTQSVKLFVSGHRKIRFLIGTDLKYAKWFSDDSMVHAYCFSDQSHRSPMPPISRIPSETSDMAVPYAY
ncbi:hypothetical protein GIB67_010481 [Kingdonia uniflora]|uniref:Retrotransposon Copia-like N-terminal domain-containing protein n=1 Tax=Kingdonia uniflora TaxID=39325 RepID=A0A7J7MAK1_9MAGN|nr:hypothetical protein GIB67_010481 [Kingdonia uniflora]